MVVVLGKPEPVMVMFVPGVAELGVKVTLGGGVIWNAAVAVIFVYRAVTV